MKRPIVSVVLLLLCSLPAAFAQHSGPAALFEQANAAAAKGEHEQAISKYVQIVRQDGVSAALLSNLADSYAAAGQIGWAVLNYERALRIAPGHADLQAKLAQLRQDAGLRQNELPLHERLAALLAPDQWLLLFGISFVVFSLARLAAGLSGEKRFPRAGSLSFFFLAGAVLTLPPALIGYQGWQNGVVTAENASLLISPFAEAESAGSLKAGSVIRPGKTHGEYVLVQDEKGRRGWLARSSFELIADLPQAEQTRNL